MSSTVVGIDLSLTSTGLAAIGEGDCIIVHTVGTKGKRDDPWSFRGSRLRGMARQIVGWVGGDDTDLVVVESPSYGSMNGSQHDRSGLWWLVVSELQSLGHAVATVTPQGRAKYGTGKGSAKKDVVEAAVRATYPQVDWPGKGKCDDIADAVILAAMGRRYLGQPIEHDLPEVNIAAVAGGAWPEMMSA